MPSTQHRSPFVSVITVIIVVIFVTLLAGPSQALHAQVPKPATPATPAPTMTAAATPAKPQPRIMVALVFGQSNAANFGETRKTAGPLVQTFFRGRWARAKDPLPGANGDGGSPWTRLGDKLIAAKLYDRVIFVPAAISSSRISEWAPDGLLHKDLLRNIREAQQAGLVFTHLLWHQGETDAALGTSTEDYQRRFIAMLSAIRAMGVDAPAFVAVTTRCGQYLPNANIRSAQFGLVSPARGIFAGPDTDQLDASYRVSSCHFNDRGLDAHATMWLKVIRDFDRAHENTPSVSVP